MPSTHHRKSMLRQPGPIRYETMTQPSYHTVEDVCNLVLGSLYCSRRELSSIGHCIVTIVLFSSSLISIRIMNERGRGGCAGNGDGEVLPLWTSALALWEVSSFLSTRASFPAVRREPTLALESFATLLLASLEASAPVPWTVSET